MPIDQGLFQLALAEGDKVCASEKHLCTAAPERHPPQRSPCLRAPTSKEERTQLTLKRQETF